MIINKKRSHKRVHLSSVQQQQQYQHAQPNCSTLPGRHKTDHNGDYQPDLLPYIPQSISFNNSSLYSFAVNQPTSFDNQQQQAQHQYHHHHKQYQQHQEKDDHQIDDLRYANNFRRGKYGTHHTDYLHYGIIELPTNSRETPTMKDHKLKDNIMNGGDEQTEITSTMTSVGTTSTTFGRRSYENESMNVVDDDHILPPRQSIIRTSPSLNFLSNYYQRRELL